MKEASLCRELEMEFQKCRQQQRLVLLSYIQMMSCAPVKQSILYGICWLSGRSRNELRCKMNAKEKPRKERISDIILPINNKFLFASFTTSPGTQPGEKENTKKSTFFFLWPSSSRFLMVRHVAHYSVIIYRLLLLLPIFHRRRISRAVSWWNFFIIFL